MPTDYRKKDDDMKLKQLAAALLSAGIAAMSLTGCFGVELGGGRAETPEALRDFDELHYRLDPDRSDENHLIFLQGGT